MITCSIFYANAVLLVSLSRHCFRAFPEKYQSAYKDSRNITLHVDAAGIRFQMPDGQIAQGDLTPIKSFVTTHKYGTSTFTLSADCRTLSEKNHAGGQELHFHRC